MANSFLEDLSSRYTGAQNASFDRQLQGRAFNLEMDKESRNFYGNKANQILNETIRDFTNLFDTEEQKEFHIMKTGGQTFGFSELDRIGKRKFDRLQPIPTDESGRPIELSPEDQAAREQARSDFANSYTTRYTNPSGFASALSEPNKIIGQVNYDSDRGTISPTLLTYDSERRQVYEAEMTFGGKQVRLGGEPMEIPVWAADAELRRYFNEIRNSAGFNTVASGLGSLYGQGISARREKETLSPLSKKLGGSPSFDPATAVARRVRLQTEYGADPNGDASQMVDPAAAEVPLQLRIKAFDGESAVSQVLDDIKKGEIRPPADGDALTGETVIATAAPVSFVTSTTLQITNKDGAWHNRKDRALDAQEIEQMARGRGGYKTAVDVIDSVDSFVYVPGTVPFFNAEQWNGMSPRLQQGYMRAARAKSDKNIRAGFEGDLVKQGVSSLEFKDIPPRIFKQAGVFPMQYPSRVVEGSGVDVAQQLSQWEDKHGEVVPLNEFGEGVELSEEALRSAKLDTLVQIRDFYATEIAGKNLLNVFKAHPAYFREFKKLGPVEFARRYINDPEFAKHRPNAKIKASQRGQVNSIGKDLEASLNVSFKLPSEVPVGQTNQAETTFKTDLSEMIDNAQPVSTALQNATAALIQDQADSNLNEADFTHMSPKQRFIFAYTIYGSMPESERDAMRPNIDSLIEFGVLKTRLDRTSTPEQTASRLNIAYQTDVEVLKSNRQWFNNIIKNELEIRRLDQTDTGLKIEQRGQNIRARTAWQNRVETTRRALFTSRNKNNIDSAKLARDMYTRVSDRLIQAANVLPGEGRVTSINKARQMRGDDLRVHINGNEFGNAINILGEELAAAVTKGEAIALSPIIDNAIVALVGGGTENNVKWWSPNTWRREVLGWMRGNVDQSRGDMKARFIAIDDQGRTIYDLNNVYHPTRNTSGQKVKVFRAIGLDGRTQKGVDMSAWGSLSKDGQNLYYLMLSHAVVTANLNYE